MIMACGVSNNGAWQNGNDPQDPQSDPPAGPPIATDNPQASPTPWAAVPTPTIQATVSCDIPEDWSYPFLLESPLEIPFYRTSTENVCFGSEGGPEGNQFCNWANRLEARYAALSGCFERSLKALEEAGTKSMGSLQAWRQLRPKYVPEAWNREPREVGQDIGYFPGWIAVLMNGGEAPQVSATPLCFRRGKDELEEARSSLGVTLWWLAATRADQIQSMETALNRGVYFTPYPDAEPVAVTVKLNNIAPSTPISESCAFRIPQAL
jgi:hypothetical protein